MLPKPSLDLPRISGQPYGAEIEKVADIPDAVKTSNNIPRHTISGSPGTMQYMLNTEGADAARRASPPLEPSKRKNRFSDFFSKIKDKSNQKNQAADAFNEALGLDADSIGLADALRELLRTEAGVSAVKQCPANAQKRIVDALVRIGDSKALRVLVNWLAHCRDDMKLISGAIQEIANNPVHLNDENVNDGVITKLIKIITGGFTNSHYLSLPMHVSSILDTLGCLGKISRDKTKGEIARAIHACMKKNHKDIYLCNKAFSTLLQIGGAAAKKYLSSFLFRKEMVDHYSYAESLCDGKCFLDILTKDQQSCSEALLAFLSSPDDDTYLRYEILNSIPKIVGAMPLQQLQDFVQKIFAESTKYKLPLSHLFHLSIFTLDMAQSSWGRTSLRLMKANGAVPPDEATDLGKALQSRLLSAQTTLPIRKDNFFSNLAKEGWKYDSFLNRTMIFERDGRYKAVKVQKKGEHVSELTRQCEVVNFLNEQKKDLGLRSDIPNAEGVYQIELNIEQHVPTKEASEFMEKIESNDDLGRCTVNAYVYDCEDRSYFNYLHAANDLGEFHAGAEKSLHDLIVMLKECNVIFPELADMYHNRSMGVRSDAGRYRAIMVPNGRSCGRLDNWTGAIEYMNLRRSGLADEGDCKFLHELILRDGELAGKYFSDIFEKEPTAAPTLLVAHTIAEYLLVLELAAGRLALEQSEGQSAAQPDAIWKEAAKRMKDLYVQTLCDYAGADPEVAKNFIENAIDWEKYSKQMQFWMSNNYIQPIIAKNIPADIYGPEVTVDVTALPEHNASLPESFQDTGFSDSGTGRDLGAFNGCNPLQEAEKARWIVTTFLSMLTNKSTDESKATLNK